MKTYKKGLLIFSAVLLLGFLPETGAEAASGIALGSTTIAHAHTGDTTNGGGCHGGVTTETYTYEEEVDDEPDWRCPDCHCHWNIGGGTCGCGYTGNAENWNYGKTHMETRTGTRTAYYVNCGRTTAAETHTLYSDKSVTSPSGTYQFTIVSTGSSSLDSTTPYLFTYGSVTQNSTSNTFTVDSSMGNQTLTVRVKSDTGALVTLYTGALTTFSMELNSSSSLNVIETDALSISATVSAARSLTWEKQIKGSKTAPSDSDWVTIDTP